MADNRTPRELESRENFQRIKEWQPPQTLPTPNPQPGWEFRWIRTSMIGVSDPTNVSAKLREGWEPVKAADHPELMYSPESNGRFKDNVEVGGLLLCKIPSEFLKQRSAYFNKQTQAQMDSVDNNFMKTNDPRMPLFSERKSEVSFGRGSK